LRQSVTRPVRDSLPCACSVTSSRRRRQSRATVRASSFALCGGSGSQVPKRGGCSIFPSMRITPSMNVRPNHNACLCKRVSADVAPSGIAMRNKRDRSRLVGNSEATVWKAAASPPSRVALMGPAASLREIRCPQGLGNIDLLSSRLGPCNMFRLLR